LIVDNKILLRLYDYVNDEVERLPPEDRQHLSANSLKSFQSLILSQGIDAYRGFGKIQKCLRPNEKQKYQIIEVFLDGIREKFLISDKATFSAYIGYAARISAYALLVVNAQPAEEEEKAAKRVPNKKNDNRYSKEKSQPANSYFAEVLKASLDENKENKEKKR